MPRVSLVHRYETNIFPGDYSNGTFLEGHVDVASQEEASAIVDRFLTTGEITLHEATDRYLSRKVAETLTSLKFLDQDRSKNFNRAEYTRSSHPFGNGFVHNERGYHYYYWLTVSS